MLHTIVTGPIVQTGELSLRVTCLGTHSNQKLDPWVQLKYPHSTDS